MSNELFPIDNLPEEVVEHIFSFLPVPDRKSASLVCTKWEKLAFCHRLLRNVTLKVQLRLKCHVLRKSNRRYRNLTIDSLDRLVGSEFENLLEILDRFADVECFVYLGNLESKHLCMVLNRLPKLQQMMVGRMIREWCPANGCRISEQLQATGTLNNVLQTERLVVPNLTQLSISFTNSDDGMDTFPILLRLAPQLKNVDLYSTDYCIPLEQLQFPKAEVLKIGGGLCNTDNDCNLRTFFTGFKLLKEVTLESTVKEIALDVLTEACPEIEIFKFEVSSYDPAPIHLLGRLKCLKTLGLGKFNKIPVISSKCNPLVSVKTLSLELSECGESSIERLRHLLPNVTAMDVTLKDNWNIGRALGAICRNFRGLQRLEISDRSTRGLTSWSSLLVLQQLDQLEELILRDVRTLMVYMPPNPLLKRFVTNFPYWLFDKDSLELARHYANLRYLDLGPIRRVTSSGIAAFKAQLVDCAVHGTPFDAEFNSD